mmetsp:Transcript_18412/g.32620  ORF Transcript_18412/g.32620 Transcript_18412/m.32620 type:complete len:107 (-) Transcript_18412:235-555(-)
MPLSSPSSSFADDQLDHTWSPLGWAETGRGGGGGETRSAQKIAEDEARGVSAELELHRPVAAVAAVAAVGAEDGGRAARSQARVEVVHVQDDASAVDALLGDVLRY